MKQLIKFGSLFGLIIINTNVHALDPVQGFYLGIMAEISHGPNTEINFLFDQMVYNAKINVGPVGGGGGASLGYKIKNFRLEGELLYNINSYEQATVGSCTLISPNVVGPEGVCPLL